jgi:alkaline phosphatase
MIGDGMGPEQIAAAGIYDHGEPGTLHMESLPVHAKIETASASGLTDSAAAATAMACGVSCNNYRVGEDSEGQPAENIVDLAHEGGWRTGVISTAAITHATPAAFTAYQRSRYDQLGIAEDQVTRSKPHVLLGGGAAYFLPKGEGSARNDDGLVDAIDQAGYAIVANADELADATTDPDTDRLFGTFALDHMTMVRSRTPEIGEPTLPEMTRAALRVLDRDGASFFLMIEGGRIDHGGHHNSIEDVVFETLAFDEAVAAVMKWMKGRDYVTLIITADHETGGLSIVEPRGAGRMPAVTWKSGEHTGVDIHMFGAGPGLEPLAGERRHHLWVNAVIRARITGNPFTAP